MHFCIHCGRTAGCYSRPPPEGAGNFHAAQLKGAAAHLPSAQACRCDALAPSPIAARTGVRPTGPGPGAGFGVLAGFSSAPVRRIRGRGPGAGASRAGWRTRGRWDVRCGRGFAYTHGTRGATGGPGVLCRRGRCQEDARKAPWAPCQEGRLGQSWVDLLQSATLVGKKTLE